MKLKSILYPHFTGHSQAYHATLATSPQQDGYILPLPDFAQADASPIRAHNLRCGQHQHISAVVAGVWRRRKILNLQHHLAFVVPARGNAAPDVYALGWQVPVIYCRLSSVRWCRTGLATS